MPRLFTSPPSCSHSWVHRDRPVPQRALHHLLSTTGTAVNNARVSDTKPQDWHNLLIATVLMGAHGGQLQPVEGAFARQGLALSLGQVVSNKKLIPAKGAFFNRSGEKCGLGCLTSLGAGDIRLLEHHDGSSRASRNRAVRITR